MDFTYICGQLSRANVDRRHAFTTVVLSSYDGEASSARWVVNRGWSIEDHSFKIYTDSRSPKVSALKDYPTVEILCYDARKKLQIRARCICHVTQSGADYDEHKRRARHRSTDYSTDIAPGTPADIYGHTDEMHFALIEATVLSYDVLQLGQPHQRIRYDRSDDWVGTSLVP